MDNLFVTIPERANYSVADPELLFYYEDLNERVWNLVSEVDDSLLDFARHVIRWNREDRGIPVEERKPIRLYINSPGGDLNIFYTVKDIIEMSKTPIVAVNLGMAYSAAALLFLSCRERYMLKSSKILLHLGSASLGGSYLDLMSAVADYQEQVESFVSAIQEKTTYTPEEIESNISSDWYIDAENALAHGAATKIIDDIDELL